jgi:hypothetical protein
MAKSSDMIGESLWVMDDKILPEVLRGREELIKNGRLVMVDEIAADRYRYDRHAWYASVGLPRQIHSLVDVINVARSLTVPLLPGDTYIVPNGESVEEFMLSLG